MPTISRLAICLGASMFAHVSISLALELLPPIEPPRVATKIEVRITEPPVVPPPEIIEAIKPPEPDKPAIPDKPVEPIKPVKPEPSARPTPTPQIAPKPAEPATLDVLKHADDSDDGPVYGVDMSSTSQGGPSMQVGHGGRGGGGGGGGSAAPAAPPAAGGHGDAPIGAYDATKMPLPQGRCFGKYTPEATAAGTEGTVVLDLTVGEDGRTRDIVATSKLANGLTESAIAALRDCHFSPGEKDGHPVAVHLRGFKIRFVLADAAP